jgi:hypothetical protein
MEAVMNKIRRGLAMCVAVGSVALLPAATSVASAASLPMAAAIVYSGTATIGNTGTLNLSTGQVNAPDSSWNLWWENNGGGGTNSMALVATHGKLHNKVSTPYATLKKARLAALTYKSDSIRGGPAPTPNKLLAGDVVGVKLPSGDYAKVKVIWNKHVNGIRITWTLYS